MQVLFGSGHAFVALYRVMPSVASYQGMPSGIP